jgi:ATP-binding cassette subfamily B protein
MIRRITKILRPNSRLLMSALVALFFAESFPFLYPLVLRQIIDGSVFAGDFPLLLRWIFLYSGVVVAHSLFLYLRILFGQHLAIGTTHALRLRMFAHLQKLPLQYFQKTPVGGLMTRLTNDVDAFGALFSDGFLELFSNVTLLIFSMAVMLWMDWRLGLATLIFFPVLLAISAWFRTRFRTLQSQYRAELASLNSFLQESLNGLGVVRVFGKQQWLLGFFRNRNDAYTHVSLRYGRRYAGFFPLVQTFSDLSLVSCYVAAIWLIGRGELTAGTLAAFAWIASIYSRPLRDLSDRINTLQNALAAGDRVVEFLETPPEPAPVGSGIVSKLEHHGSNALDFKNLQFAYNPGNNVLHGISFSVPVGARVALVGPTGCGKSTCLQLILRFLEPASGSIDLFGVPLGQIQATELHRQIAWLGQDPFLFPGTIAENISLGRAWNEVLFLDICKRAQILKMIESFPLGRNTLVGTGGTELSSGQRQLVAYARALYQDPAILLLDEPTASIDASTEWELNLALQELLQGRTALIVSHRASSIAVCDRVICMRQGTIVESGTHASLMANPGYYAKLFERISGKIN